VLNLEPIADKFKAFNWNVTEIDGHNHADIKQSLHKIEKAKPSVVIAHTIKGKGVSFMENKLLWHYRSPNEEEFEKAIKEL
jgi:transketolase